jgi:hypothetical protein
MSIERTAIFAVALALAVSGALAAPPAFAQAVDEAARDTIIGEEEVAAAAEPQRVIAAIDRTPENIPAVRKTIRLDRVEIVFLADAAATEGGPPPEIAAKVEERKDEIAELRKELEGNAMLYHAIDSRQVLVRDVLAVEFDGAGVLIYAAAKPPAG